MHHHTKQLVKKLSDGAFPPENIPPHYGLCYSLFQRDQCNVPIMCVIDASSRVATNHHDDLNLFTFLFSNRMLLDK